MPPPGDLRTLSRLLTGALPPMDADADLPRNSFGIPHWERLVALARRHGVSPFLFHTVRACRESLPADAWQLLRGDYYAAVVRSLVQEQELKRVLRALHDADVPVVLLKGAAWARTVYPDPALRTMADLDLWVPREQLDTARQAMTSLGYSSHSKPDRPLALQDAFLGETQMTSQSPGTGLVELHWNAFPGEWLRHSARIDEAAIWERSIPVDGVDANQLAPEDAMLNACTHLAINHQLDGLGLRPLLDLELMRRKWQIDWNVLSRRARIWRVATATWLILHLWASLFGDEEADSALRLLRPSPIRQWILRRLFPGEFLAEGRRLRKGLERRAFLLFLVDHPADAARLLWRAFFPEREWLTLLYGLEGAPRWRIRLRQVLHPIQVLIRRDL